MSFFQKLKAGLSKTKEGMLKNLDGLFGGHKIEEDFYEELEEILIMSDVGSAVSGKIVSQLRAKVKEAGCRDTAEAKELLKEIIVQMMQGGEELDLSTQPSVILVIGVNGVGKTTTIGKMAHDLTKKGKKSCWARQIRFGQRLSTSCKSGQTGPVWAWLSTPKEQIRPQWYLIPSLPGRPGMRM